MLLSAWFWGVAHKQNEKQNAQSKYRARSKWTASLTMTLPRWNLPPSTRERLTIYGTTVCRLKVVQTEKQYSRFQVFQSFEFQVMGQRQRANLALAGLKVQSGNPLRAVV